jgi:hypothetical protein
MASAPPSGSAKPSYSGRPDEIAAAELRALKPGAKVYERKSAIFFLSSRDTALQNTQERLSAEKQLEVDAASK